jgi:hypothetical protein
VPVGSKIRYVSSFSAATCRDAASGIGAEETALAETVMDVLSEAGTKWSAMARPGVDLAALKRAQLFGSDIQAPTRRRRSGSAPPAAAPASCARIGRARLSPHISAAPG